MSMERYQFIVLIVISIRFAVTSNSLCSEKQICVPIDHCSSVNQRLYEENLNSSEIIYLGSLQCGYIDDKIYVCCNSSLPQPEECVNVNLKVRIVDGDQTELGEYPFAVLIGRRWKEANNITGISYACGGSLISDRYVLTAAHCVKFLNYIDYRERIQTIELVKLGEWNTETNPDEEGDTKSDPVVEAVVEKIIPHKNYRLTKQYDDIALLRLKEKVNFTKFIQPICLPDEQEQFIGQLKVIGWGKSDNNYNDIETIQRFADINLIDNKECDEIYDNYKIKSTQICAGSFGKDSCGGDSGGPLVGLNTTNNIYYLAGVVSFGRRKCGTVGQPGVYTDVRKYLNWIQQNMIH